MKLKSGVEEGRGRGPPWSLSFFTIKGCFGGNFLFEDKVLYKNFVSRDIASGECGCETSCQLLELEKIQVKLGHCIFIVK